MADDSRIAVLRAVPGLQDYPKKALARLAPIFDVDEARAGEVLVRQGQASREMFVVVEGEAVVLRDGAEIATIGPGEFIGEMGMLELRPRCATVVARTDMRVLVVGPEQFRRVLDAPALLRRMSNDIASRRQRTYE